MITNIVDNREKCHRWKSIKAIIEPTFHDNFCPSADQAAEVEDVPIYDEKTHISIADAIAWANTFEHQVTLYLYNCGLKEDND